MLTTGINFINFKKTINKKLNLQIISFLKKEKNQVIKSLSKNYKNNFNKKFIKKFYAFKNFRLIGMGGSILGSQTIYDFLKSKIKKNFYFIDNLSSKIKEEKKTITNLIISKSGNTIETIVNSNVLLKSKDQNIFITENKKNYLHHLAKKLKAEIVHHNNFIGGRYSVLSEVGMLPAELMGLQSKNFRQYNSLIKNKKFVNELVNNVSSTLYFIKKKKFNSIIINYDPQSDSLFKW